MNEIQHEWSELFNNAPFDYFFLDTYFDTFYKEERQFTECIRFLFYHRRDHHLHGAFWIVAI